MTTTDTTNDAKARVAVCVTYLRRHGHAIGDAARAGNDLGKRIMVAYKAVHASPEAEAVAVLEGAIAEHRTSRATPPYKMPEDDCDHDGEPEKLAEPKGAERCLDCGMVFRCCWGCSELAEGPVWHAEPMCGVQDAPTPPVVPELTRADLTTLLLEHLTDEENRLVIRVCTDQPALVESLTALDGGKVMTGRETARWFLDVCRKVDAAGAA